MADTSKPAYSAAFDAQVDIKRHAACDECRKRKLKCSGEPAGCARCLKQKLTCHYSEQKQMGRPRKRQKTDDEPPTPSQKRGVATSPRPIQPAVAKIGLEQPCQAEIIDPALAVMHNERSQFENICTAPVAQAIRSQRTTSNQSNGTPVLDTGTPPSQNRAPTPDTFDIFNTAYPTDVAQWPDFSTLEMLPLPVGDKFSGVEPDGLSSIDPDVNPEALSNLPSVPACPCLPNLYLTLSTLSTLSSFPFTRQTINTVESAYKTAKGVIYCPVCPQKFDTGSSNLMLACTLLNVLADQWNRLRKLVPDELRKSFGTVESQKSFVTTKEGQEWRLFVHNMIRAYAFGDAAIPTPPGVPASAPDTYPPLTLNGLCNALERRQRQWHRLDEATSEFPDRVTPELQAGHLVGDEDNPGKHLCLEIVNHAKCIVNALDKPTHCVR
ncbi:hypothetical protein LTR64_007983 [Lithohypha guttulata]